MISRADSEKRAQRPPVFPLVPLSLQVVPGELETGAVVGGSRLEQGKGFPVSSCEEPLETQGKEHMMNEKVLSQLRK